MPQHAPFFASYENILLTRTSPLWAQQALKSLDLLLIDHANCEKKAAAAAMSLLFSYTHYISIQRTMSRLAREELRHYEHVLTCMNKRNITYRNLSASPYAEKLQKHVRSSGIDRLIDRLVVGAFIEARSCERFSTLITPLQTVDEDLSRFYQRLWRSEARHFHDYLKLAYTIAPQESVHERIDAFAKIEGHAITTPDTALRFHSGFAFSCDR